MATRSLARQAPSRQPGTRLDDLGQARRWALADDAQGGELWRLADAAVAARLLALGGEGIGGFVEGGEDEEGPWLVRGGARRLSALGKSERLEANAALRVVGGLAGALAACERLGLFPGALQPGQIAVEPPGVLADPLVSALVGARAEAAPRTAPSPRWTPPEQSAGAAWDNAANRYVLGLAAYRLLTGLHPFAERSLRHALAEQARGDVPPFADEVAATLRPGIQSLVLSLLAATPSARPLSAAAIAARLGELAADGERSRGGSSLVARGVPARAPPVDTGVGQGGAFLGTPPRRRPEGTPRAGTAAPPRARPRAERWRKLAPLAVGGVVLAISAAMAAERQDPAPVPRLEAKPLRGTRAADCAPCHARQVSEWQRSVMAHSSRSPLFGALESAVEEQVFRDSSCSRGAGVLRRPSADACRDERTGVPTSGSGGEGWCINCHAMGDNLDGRVPPWTSAAQSRKPLRDLLSEEALEGISCAGCHQTVGPVGAHALQQRRGAAYEGNPTWTSPFTGVVFPMRPEDARGTTGISNSGYNLLAGLLLRRDRDTPAGGRPHEELGRINGDYLRSSEFCGACHDVRLFGTDTVGAARGEHFKRLRNAYSEWRAWSDTERAAGRSAASCQDCHMSLYPGVCAPGPGGSAPSDARGIGASCPSGTHFEARAPGARALAAAAPSAAERRVASHYFTSVDIPLTEGYPAAFADETRLDATGLPLGLRARRDMLLRSAFSFDMGPVRAVAGRLEIPLRIENVGAGHRVPAGFSQEREIWVELTVTDARGRPVYQVGHVATNDEDLQDKTFARITTSDSVTDERGRPLGVFGADVLDGPDVPAWTPNPQQGGTTFRGRGLVNLQNGFLRCVRCIGIVDAAGRCQPGPGQGHTRADRYDDGAYDLDTGECRSNLSAGNELFETYFPVGALDADRGVLKAPDAIIDTRSAPPHVPLTYTYDLETRGQPGPFRVEARLRFRAFPPFLLKAFADYEARQAARGLRPSGPQVTRAMLQRLEITDLATRSAEVGP